LHGREARKPLEGQSYGKGYGGRVLARRGKSGTRRAPPRARPQPTAPNTGFTPPKPVDTPPTVSPQKTPSTITPDRPVQKQYGQEEVPTIVEPKEIEETIEVEEIPEEETPIPVVEEVTIQDGAERRSLGLTSLEETDIEPEVQVESDEDRTSALLQKSLSSALDAGYDITTQAQRIPQAEPEPEKKVRTPRRISKAKKNNQRVEQRATRARRLDRSRHVEYRYEMRALLKEIEVSSEHHSVLLGSIWAKGERQDANTAKEFVRERMASGAINEDQCNRLLSIIDAYTTRR
jgi:hypothetical protein